MSIRRKNKMWCLLVGLLVICSAELAYSMGRIPKKEYQAKVSALEECVNRSDALERNIEEAKNQVSALENKNSELLKNMESSTSVLQRKLAGLLKEKEEIEKAKAEEVEKLKSTYDQLIADMKKEIDQGSIQITQLKDRLSVNLVDKILFNSGEAEVNPQGKQVLKRVAEILKKVKGKQIRIEGHTDNVPIGGVLKEKFPSNWELSTARATNVTRYLQEIGGIDPKIIFVAGFSEYRPIADNASPEGRSKNRRIEIALVPLEDTAASASPLPQLEKSPKKK